LVNNDHHALQSLAWGVVEMDHRAQLRYRLAFLS
jgi:hypothetical protein